MSSSDDSDAINKFEIYETSKVQLDPETEEMFSSMEKFEVNNHPYYVEDKISEEYLYAMYNVIDKFKRKFILRIIRHTPITEYINCIALLKGKSCIASVYEYQPQNKNIFVVFETGKPVDPMEIPKNLIKRRVRQILTAISSLNSAQLHFAQIEIDDFIDTNGGFRFINIENAIIGKKNASEKTFDPAVKIINALVEPRRITLDPKLYREIHQMGEKASMTEISKLENLLRTDLFQDSVRVNFVSRQNSRSATPDPHTHIIKKQQSQTIKPKAKLQRPLHEEPAIMLINPGQLPSYSQLIFCCIGAFICLFITLYIHFSAVSSVSFTNLMLKLVWVGICLCGAFSFAAMKQYGNLNNAEYFIETVSNLRKLFNLLTAYLLFVVGAYAVEFNSIDVISVTLTAILLILLVTNLLV
ncbi:hypothetical protein TVAG_280590 [Trichomonas vaginalis G3]|uniref:Uncharacterized protein n=1 Tax=Trichomonas vaginalis (strain ATCC PRA-98 / G3) TaxID=412133 RepID=A2DRI0_TRIV3|nr:hypothetical protein TVAGG3_0697410 [Trichomonas vaginalis G3]EAY16943.1 hypothetical protein TVAG_280590 [Trichomonas vaginalis G3]KAI5509014.1 hypothetical protein TVAGG3_0697410 [Trichomonas vaginalis G3]|eukprot:XP_001329166.1 hypothetical protein [Trichomonas vaginalis G3]